MWVWTRLSKTKGELRTLGVKSLEWTWGQESDGELARLNVEDQREKQFQDQIRIGPELGEDE